MVARGEAVMCYTGKGSNRYKLPVIIQIIHKDVMYSIENIINHLW